MENDHFDNTPDSGSGFWTIILVLLILFCVGYFYNLHGDSNATSDYWEIRISHSPNGYEIKKYDYDEILREAQQIVEDSLSE